MNADDLRRRLAQRSGHFMPTGLLESQLAALERPEPANELARIIDAPL